MRFKISRYWIIVLLCFFSENVLGITHHVLMEVPVTIQDAIDAANDGDTVLVGDGTFSGEGNKNLDYNGKSILVKSLNGPEYTSIDCEFDGMGFYFHSGEDQNAKVEAFTILNGRSLTGGGGIHAEYSTPQIDNCIIQNCNSFTAIYVYGFNSSIINCEISSNREVNRAGAGGGIFCQNSELMLENCLINGNAASSFGGGIYIYNSGVQVFSCELTENRTNTVNEGIGGGIYCDESNLFVSNCIISSNTTDDRGGGIACWSSDVIIQDSYFSNNGTSRNGGAIHLWDIGIGCIDRCVFEKNVAVDYGGGIYSSHCDSINITNCTLYNNRSLEEGGGLYTNMETVEILNCIIWGNSPDEIGCYSCDPIVQYSNIGGGWTGEGNIDSDPLFIEPDSLDFNLLPDSPCIDAGDPVFDVPPGGGRRIDIGACEYWFGWNISRRNIAN